MTYELYSKQVKGLKEMRLEIILLLTLCCLNLSAGLKPDKAEYDFGHLANIDSALVSVVLQNTGVKDVVLEAVRLSCGCATANYKKSSVIPPQGKTTLTIKFSPKEFSGRVRKPFYIKFKETGEGGKSETLRLFIRALVKKELALSPDTLVFNDLRKSREQILQITNTGQSAVKDLTFTVNKKFCYISNADKMKVIKAGETKAVKVLIDPSFNSEKRAYCRVTLSGKKGLEPFSLDTTVRVNSSSH